MINVQTLKHDFPLFAHHPNLVYLDSAATSLKPQIVIDTEQKYLEHFSANVGRGLYPLAEIATEKFELARTKIAHFIGASDPKEIIFTSGTTASLNLVAQLLQSYLKPNSNIVITALEHHSNYLPWKELAQRNSVELRVAPFTPDGFIDTEALVKLVDDNTVIVSFSALSNVLGAINPTANMVQAIKSKSEKTLIVVDAAQAIGHIPINVSTWNADFVAFSAHKCYGPPGVGVLYGKASLLTTLAPVTFGGGMVLDACKKDTLYREIPYRFEAGTPNIGGAIAFGAALDYIGHIGLDNIRSHEVSLTTYALKHLRETFGSAIRIIGPLDTERRGGIMAFSFSALHPHDIAHLLGEQNICVRAGEHCAAPLHRALGLPATTRISFGIYNTKDDVDRFMSELKKIVTLFKM